MRIQKKHPVILLSLIILLWTLVVGYAAVQKYHAFGFDAIDLGIYTQVFHDTAEGHLFQFTIHPHSYLGDHFELFILALTPFYMLWRGPEVLLILQALAVASAAIPLFILARRVLNGRWAWAIAGIYLLYPVIFNISFFEFHILPFAIPLLAWLFYLYYRKRFAGFVILALLALTVREDVALVIGMFGILALIEKRSWRWILTPIILAGVWFLTAMQLTGYLNQSGGYKFVELYSWLGNTPGEIIKTAITKPWLPLRQIVSLNNLLLILGMALPLAGLPLLYWRYYIPAALIALQLFLMPLSVSIVMETHYTSLLIPFIFIAAIFGLSRPSRIRNRIMHLLKPLSPLPAVLLGAAVLYSFVTLSPVSSIYAKPDINGENSATISIKRNIIESVRPTDAVVSGFDTLPALATRDRIYSLHYAFLGHRQYSDVPFEISLPIQRVIFDATDFIVYQFQAQNILSYTKFYNEGADRIRDLIMDNDLSVTTAADSVLQFSSGELPATTLVTTDATLPKDATVVDASLGNTLAMRAWSPNTTYQPPLNTGQLVPLQLYWMPEQKTDTDYVLDLQLLDSDGTLAYHKYYPLGYGLWPTSTWEVGEIVQTNYWFVVPDNFPLDHYTLQLQVTSLEGYMTLDSQRSTAMHISADEHIGPAIPITLE